MLAELGARVIKIEQPGLGDYYRAVAGGDTLGGRQVHLLNYGKESLGLDLKTDPGREIFKKLARKADVVIESFRPGTLRRLKIDFKVLTKINRRLILCSITGAGQKGPLSHLAGHDLNYLGLSGLLLKIRDETGRLVVPDFQVVDLAVGQAAALQIVAALSSRAKTKRGVWLDCSMKDTALSMARLYPPRKRSLLGGGRARYGAYETLDGRYVTLAALEPKFWERFCEIVGRPEWKSDPLTGGEEEPKRKEEIQEIFRSKTVAEWEEIGRKSDICLFPVEETPPALFEGKTFEALGHHTNKILRGLGYRPGQIKEWKVQGVIA